MTFDMNKLIRGEPQHEQEEGEREPSIGGKSDGGKGGDDEPRFWHKDMNVLLREARYGWNV